MQVEQGTNCIDLNPQRIKHGKDTVLVVICAYMTPIVGTV